MLEIFLGRKIDGGKFDLWSNRFFSLAHSTGRHEKSAQHLLSNESMRARGCRAIFIVIGAQWFWLVFSWFSVCTVTQSAGGQLLYY